MSRTLVFVYDHFYPDYSAGGPITSLANLAKLLGGSCTIKILTSAYYYDSGKSFTGIALDQWTTSGNFTAWYATSSASIIHAIDSLPADATVYLNGIFSTNYFLGVLRHARKRKLDIVVSPRGMLQAGALRNKSFKKQAYLFVLKAFGLLKGVRWHATDDQERADIRSQFGSQSIVEVIPNIPRQPATKSSGIVKEPGALKLIYFSLVARKKNVGFVVDLLASSELTGVTLDIVGPIKDKDYWNECQDSIGRANGTVNYLGDVNPDSVNDLLSKYHLFVLPTHGENFGHAILEALSSWRPVLISEYTPWRDVTFLGGSFSIPLVSSQWTEKLKEVRSWNQEQFDNVAVTAMEYFRKKINMSAMRSMYLSLFRIQS